MTAGPTREYIDTVRFITNASSGRMGCAVAQAAGLAGHEVTLLAGPLAVAIPRRCKVVRFVSVADLREALDEHFESCDALVMAAAVGDFLVEDPSAEKLHRSTGPMTLRLLPTEDVLAGLSGRKRRGQIVMAFAVEDGRPEQIEAKAREKMVTKGADYVVVNTPAAIGATESDACILSRDGVALAWASRSKDQLARRIVEIVARSPAG